MTTIDVSGAAVDLGGTRVLSGVSLTIPSGSRTALVGASGSGKSTLLRLIAGFEPAAAGDVRLDGRVVARDGFSVPAHRRGIAYVPQEGALFPHLTVARNIAFGLRDRRGGARSARVAEVAELVALDLSLLERFPHELSGGQQQRVALARALAPSPGVVLLDEPFSALDTGLRDATRQAVVRALDLTGVTCVLVTHDQQEALEFGDQVGVLAAGRLVDVGAPVPLFDAPTSLETALFLGPGLVLGGVVRSGRVSTALGELTVGEDRRTNASARVRVLVRPEQVILGALDGLTGPAHPIRIVSLSPKGARASVTVGLGDGESATLEVERHVADILREGADARAGVAGKVTIYSE